MNPYAIAHRNKAVNHCIPIAFPMDIASIIAPTGTMMKPAPMLWNRKTIAKQTWTRVAVATDQFPASVSDSFTNFKMNEWLSVLFKL